MKETKFTSNELSLIESALNHYWNDAHEQLNESKRPLGDIEKQQLKKRLQLAKDLMSKMNYGF